MIVFPFIQNIMIIKYIYIYTQKNTVPDDGLAVGELLLDHLR
jgi:hypothetical protein